MLQRFIPQKFFVKRLGNMNFLITGGSGFIGSCLIRHLLEHTPHRVLNLDKLTYAGNQESLENHELDPRYAFVQADICDSSQLKSIVSKFRPHRIIHLAAESHVDRSVSLPDAFIQTNILGTFSLLQAVNAYRNEESERDFLFHHVSTDEVFGSLGEHGSFSETSPYSPRSPYSASKAASDHLVRAWGATYGLPFIISNCSNNYGPYQFPEKLIPRVIHKALKKKSLPIYGTGANIRDWLFVEDHARALYLIATEGRIGQSYNIGGLEEKTNLEVVRTICKLLQERLAHEGTFRFENLITYVEDRPGHDYRYSIDTKKIQAELGWKPKEDFESGIKKTVDWYLQNKSWGEKYAGL